MATKKDFSEKITNNQIDSIYKYAIQHGAMGGKLMGAEVVFSILCIPSGRNDLINAMKKGSSNTSFYLIKKELVMDYRQ